MKQLFELKLSALDSTDCDAIRVWRNDYQIWRWCRQSDFISDVEQSAWFERQAEDPTIKMYKVVREHAGQSITVGVCGFTSINMLSRHAEFSLYIAPEFQGKRYGLTALGLLLMHGFSNLGFNMIWGEVIAGNPALNMFAAVGFKGDGLRRQFYWKDGAVHDAHLISMTVREYYDRINSARNQPADAGGPDLSLVSEAAPGPVGDSAQSEQATTTSEAGQSREAQAPGHN